VIKIECKYDFLYNKLQGKNETQIAIPAAANEISALGAAGGTVAAAEAEAVAAAVTAELEWSSMSLNLH
jgi:hypothetical protein